MLNGLLILHEFARGSKISTVETIWFPSYPPRAHLKHMFTVSKSILQSMSEETSSNNILIVTSNCLTECKDSAIANYSLHPIKHVSTLLKFVYLDTK
jgi:hypothetical protein